MQTSHNRRILSRENIISPPATSKILSEIAEAPKRAFTIGDMLKSLESRSFGMTVLLFALPNALPFPLPGISTITGVALLIVAVQLMFGAEHLWLPRRVLAFTLPPAKRKPFFTRASRILRWLEQWLKPRLPFFTTPLSDRISGLFIFLLSCLVAMPIPFGNMPPGMAIAILALAMVMRDGRVILLGWLGSLLMLFAYSAALQSLIESIEELLAG